MEVLLNIRSGCSSIRILCRKCAIFCATRHLYILDICTGASKIYVESEDVIVSYDIFYKWPETYFCHTTQNGSLYVTRVNLPSDESSDLGGSCKTIKPFLHEQVWKPSSLSLELIAINSEKENCWFLEDVSVFDKKLTCYHIHCRDNKFTFDLLWMCDYKQSEFVNNGVCTEDFISMTTTKSFIIISRTSNDILSLADTYITDDKFIKISDALFINLFGVQNNLERQSIIMVCFPDGVIHWFPESKSMKMSVNVLWNMHENIVSVHSVELVSLNKRGITQEVNCLVVIGKSGSIVIFGLCQYPANLQLQTHCQINSSDVFGDNLLFSTSKGIYMFCLSDIAKDSSIGIVDKIFPKLISHHKVRYVKIYNSCKESVKLLAKLPDGRIVKLSLSLMENKLAGQMMKRPNVKNILASIEAITQQSKETQKSCDALSKDFSNLCVASHILHSFKNCSDTIEPRLQWLKEPNKDNLSNFNPDVCIDYQCLSKTVQCHNVTVNFHFSKSILNDGRHCSFVACIVPSQYIDSFPRNLMKFVSANKSISEDGVVNKSRKSKCSISFLCYLSPGVLPLSVLTYVSFECKTGHCLPPLLIPLKTFEAGILKFVSSVNLQDISNFSDNMGIGDLIRIKQSNKSTSNLLEVGILESVPEKWQSVYVTLNQQTASEGIEPSDIWRILFLGNSDVFHKNSNIVEFYFMHSLPIKMEISSCSGATDVLIISSTSMSVLSLLHREILLILYKTKYLSLPEKPSLPIMKPCDVMEPPIKWLRLDGDDDVTIDSTSPIDDLQHLLHCYKIHRSS